jgi:hypothetical protein
MIKNLTPHRITIHGVDGFAVHTVPPSGTVPRCAQTSTSVGQADWEVPITRQEFGAVEGLPEAEPGVWLVVARLIAERCPERDDLLVPGPAVRDAEGRVVGCQGLATLAHQGATIG